MQASKLKMFSMIVAGVLIASGKSAVSQQESTMKLKDGFDVNPLDKTIDPCIDFYHYACGTWLKQNPVPPDRSIYGRSSELTDRNQAILRDTLEKTSAPDPGRTANEQKIGDYYASCMDESTIEKRGTAALQPELARIVALKAKDGLPTLMAHFSMVGMNAFFGLGVQQDAKDSAQQIAVVYQGGLGLPDRDFYFRDDAKSVEIRKQYLQHAQNMFEFFGESPKEAAAHTQIAMRIETALATAALDRVARRDPNNVYHKMDVQELQALSPAFNWSKFLSQIGLTGTSTLNVSEPKFVRQVQTLTASNSLDDIQVYLRWRVIGAQACSCPRRLITKSLTFTARCWRDSRSNSRAGNGV